MRFRAGGRTPTGVSFMITFPQGLSVAPPRPVPLSSLDVRREREFLRRELLRRIVDRETKRQTARGLIR
jgi:hypothetical protein